jgi:hypothetical protein
VILNLFLLATPIFGFSLALDPAIVARPAFAPAASAIVVDLSQVAQEEPVVAEPAPGSLSPSELAEQMKRRDRMGRIHRAFGIATWASMTVAVALGAIQAYNLYGFFMSQGDTPCVEGRAVFGQGACLGTPVPHLVSGLTTAALYYTTFALSYGMPDPMRLSEGDSRSARRLRTHKRLRWVHFAGMAAQMVLGIVIANDRAFGLDRANHYDALRALSGVHLLAGLATYGTLTWSGAIMMKR